MKNFGLLEGIQEVTAYVLGQAKMPIIPYNESGDWERWLPKFEHQAEHFETNGCTVYATLNQIETFYSFLFGKEPDFSERYTYLLTPVNPRTGAYPQYVYDCIREYGLLDERRLKDEDNLKDFLDVRDITGSIKAKGVRWLQKHDFRHEWLWNGPPKNHLDVLKHALKSSPIAVSVTAWIKEGGKYVDGNLKNNHWCLCYKVDEQGIHIYDTYDAKKKILDPNHRIQMAKRIWINKLTRHASKSHLEKLQEILRRLQIMKPTLIDVAKSWLGKDASPNDLAPDELGCAETVTEILKKVYAEVPVITGTWTLWDYFRNNDTKWFPLLEPEPGCIILSPTGSSKLGSKAPYPGHTGIMLDDGTIASNDSFTGKFERNYDLDTWRKRYQEKGGYPVYFYKHI